MHPIIDLRSDTVTQPTPSMRRAMAECAVGDDVLGDDPTVQELEALMARETGMEAALFTPSGTMANQIAVACHTSPGDSVLIEDEAHILFYEVGAPAVLSSVITRGVQGDAGIMSREALESKFMVGNLHTPGTTLLCIENTHNRSGGRTVPMSAMRTYREFADEKGIQLHLDGARAYNAAVDLGIPLKEITGLCDTVSICLSKGLGAPVGSVLCGPKPFIQKAMMWRKRLGGGMRQAGVLAACGIIGVKEIVPILHNDHERAKRLCAGLQGIPGLRAETATNFVMIHTEKPGAEWLTELAKHDVRALTAAPKRVRLVLHHQITDEMVDRTIEAFKRAAQS